MIPSWNGLSAQSFWLTPLRESNWKFTSPLSLFIPSSSAPLSPSILFPQDGPGNLEHLKSKKAAQTGCLTCLCHWHSISIGEDWLPKREGERSTKKRQDLKPCLIRRFIKTDIVWHGILQVGPSKLKFPRWFFFLNLFYFVALCFWRISQLENLKKIASQRESGWPNSLQLRCNWVSSVRKVFSKYHNTIQIRASGKLSSRWMCLIDILGGKKWYFLKVFCIFSIVLTWSFVKRANHCWHSSTGKSLNFIHYCTHYIWSKVHALKVTLLCNSVNKIYFLSCSSVFVDVFEQSSKLV